MKNLFSILLLLGLVGPVSAVIISETHPFVSGAAIPDGGGTGSALSDVQSISSGIGSITQVTLELQISGDFIGGLYATLGSSNGGFAVLLNRPGLEEFPLPALGSAGSGVDATFDDTATNGDPRSYQAILGVSAPLTGDWMPDGRLVPGAATASPRDQFLATFNGFDANADWTLFVADFVGGTPLTLEGWTLNITGEELVAVGGVPEPGTLMLYAAFLGALPWIRRMRRVQAKA